MRDGLRSWQTGALQQRVWSVAAQGAAPLVALALLCRAAKVARQTGRAPAERLSERFGTYSTPRPRGRLVWIHAASLGEGAAAAPLVHAIRAAHPDQLSILVSASSAAALEARLTSPAWATCELALLPLDTLAATRAFFAHWRPCAAVFVESELWPNLLEEACCAEVPVALVNARMSATSAWRWSSRLAAPLARRMLRSMRVICPANVAEEQALRKLCPQASFGPVGDLKAAAAYAGRTAAAPSALAAAIFACRRAGRFVWVAASTHAGEEAEAATAHVRLKAEGHNPLAIIAPRHPARAAAVVDELAQQHPSLRFALLSRDGAHSMEHSDAVFVDAFGILPELYAAASVAFVGNSLVPGGQGHNLAEAAAESCVILAGPYLGPFASMAEQLCAANAMSIVANAAELYAALSELRNAPEICARRGLAAGAASAELAAGVLQRVFDALSAALALDT